MYENVEDVVSKLNTLIWGENAEHEENFDIGFFYGGNESFQIIKFEDTVLWNSEDDERGFNEELDGYEDLFTHCRDKFKEYTDRVIKLNILINGSI